jgi:hypothetical protein
MHSGLLVTHQNVLELVLLEDFVVDRQDRPAGVAEYELNAFLLKTSDGDLGAGQIDLRDNSRGGHFHFCDPCCEISLLGQKPRAGDADGNQ